MVLIVVRSYYYIYNYCVLFNKEQLPRRELFCVLYNYELSSTKRLPRNKGVRNSAFKAVTCLCVTCFVCHVTRYTLSCWSLDPSRPTRWLVAVIRCYCLILAVYKLSCISHVSSETAPYSRLRFSNSVYMISCTVSINPLFLFCLSSLY